MTGSIKLFDR